MAAKIVLAAILVLALGACTQVDRAVKGIQTAPGGWVGTNTHTDMTSDVQYLGASMDGIVIVRLANGTTQLWKLGR